MSMVLPHVRPLACRRPSRPLPLDQAPFPARLSPVHLALCPSRSQAVHSTTYALVCFLLPRLVLWMLLPLRWQRRWAREQVILLPRRFLSPACACWTLATVGEADRPSLCSCPSLTWRQRPRRRRRRQTQRSTPRARASSWTHAGLTELLLLACRSCWSWLIQVGRRRRRRIVLADAWARERVAQSRGCGSQQASAPVRLGPVVKRVSMSTRDKLIEHMRRTPR